MFSVKEPNNQTTEAIVDTMEPALGFTPEWNLREVYDQFNTPIVDISIDCSALGKFNYSITLSSEGYLEINLLSGDVGTCCFYIGEAAVNEFIASLQEPIK